MSSSDIAVSVRGLSKAYTIAHNDERQVTLAEQVLHRLRNPFKRATTETFHALKDVEFDIKKGDVVGIIGRNGAGKSTLLKILSRITEPTAGEIRLYGRVGSLLEVGTGFHPELTGRENIYLNGQILGMRKREIDKQFDAIVDFAGVERFLDTPVKRYSSGMYVRLAFAVAAHLDSEILVVDEVLAVGDGEFQRKCLGKMKDVATDGRTVLFVSHNMAAINVLCKRAAFLQHGNLVRYGNVAEIVSLYSKAAQSNTFMPSSGPLQSVRVEQVGETIRVTAEFEHLEALRLPNLGIVISDLTGTPICGASPVIAGIERAPTASRRGRVIAELRHPVLLDGQYHASIYFGDGHHDFVSFPSCLTFEIAGMAGPKQLPVSIVGPVAPYCVFRFEPDSVCSPEVEPVSVGAP